jgi:hypothetical protein
VTPSAFSVKVARPTALPDASISGTSSASTAGVAIGVACWAAIGVAACAAAIGVAFSGVAMGVLSWAVAVNDVGMVRPAQSNVVIANRPAIE